MTSTHLRAAAVALRRKGMSYGEIQKALNARIPKSTLSYWCKGQQMSPAALNRIERRIAMGGEKGRASALATKRLRRERRTKDLQKSNANLASLIYADTETSKAVLAVLYLAEGGKRYNGSVMFGNSDPHIITLFLKLFSVVYGPEPAKFRCTVQCRADQNAIALERFWSKHTGIPRRQFYKARIDRRTIGKISRKKDYKGVCRIEYFSADVYRDLLIAGQVISGNM